MSESGPKSDGDSFIVLDSMPSWGLKNSAESFFSSNRNNNVDNALENMSQSLDFIVKSQMKHEEGPSPASLMIASTIVTEDKTMEELQKSFSQILDENNILKETLKQNNESMRDQLSLIASCQEDLVKTQSIHHDKFEETRELIERLRQENKHLRKQLDSQAESHSSQAALQTSHRNDSINSQHQTTHANGPRGTSETDETICELQKKLKAYEQQITELQNENQQYKTQGEGQSGGDSSKAGDGPVEPSGPLSGVVFVSSPDDDTIHKLTAQLELVEKQRREVIFENQKLTWQKDSLEHMIDVTTKERDELKEKINELEASLFEDKCKMEEAVSKMQMEVMQAKKKILELETLRMENAKIKSENNEILKVCKDQIKDLTTRLKEAYTVISEPTGHALDLTSTDNNVELADFKSKVKTYEQIVKHMGEFLSSVSHWTIDCMSEAMVTVVKLQEFKLERADVDQVRQGLNVLKKHLEKSHNRILEDRKQLKGMLNIFEGIFKDYKQLLQQSIDVQSNQGRLNESNSQQPDIEALTAALVARGEEVQTLTEEVARLRSEGEDLTLLRAQLDLYKSDFELEREAREKLACEKENLSMAHKSIEKKYETALAQLEEMAKRDPEVYRQVCASTPMQAQAPITPQAAAAAAAARRAQASATRHSPANGAAASSPTGRAGGNTTGPPHLYNGPQSNNPHKPLQRLQPQPPQIPQEKTEYKCPKCMRFTSSDYDVMEDHFDFCLDDF